MKISEFKNGIMSYREMTQEEVTDYEKKMKEQEELKKSATPTLEEQVVALQKSLITEKTSGGV